MFAHGRKIGLRAPINFFQLFLMLCLLGVFIDWSYVIPEDPEETWMPYVLQVKIYYLPMFCCMRFVSVAVSTYLSFPGTRDNDSDKQF